MLLHKQQNSIPPIVDWKDSPSYKLARFVATKLKEMVQLPNAYNVINSTDLIESLSRLEINEHIKLCSFDITNMYTNIPLAETINIIHCILNNNKQIHLR
jgi:hypothetical protein